VRWRGHHQVLDGGQAGGIPDQPSVGVGLRGGVIPTALDPIPLT
jgi:hypothetical protein